MLRRPLPLNRLRQLRERPQPQQLARRSSQASRASRIGRVTSKLPRRLQKYTNGLRNSPISYVVSFLILHEITALVPLWALFALFHYTTFVPITYVTEDFGGNVQSGIARFESYFRRRGWFGFGQEQATGPEPAAETQDTSHTEDILDRCKKGERKYEVLVEVALAYAMTKALLPIRIIGSVWATPWFAGVLMRIKGMMIRKP